MSKLSWILCLAFCTCVSAAASARTINWSGYNWWVRTSGNAPQGPGPNIFSDSAENVFVDSGGNLHLKIRKGGDGKWLASEIDLNQSLSYGTYEWQVSSRYDLYPTNVVGGLFTYLSPESVASQTGGAVGNGVADTAHEIDIEFTKAWGNGHLYFTTHDGDVPAPSKNYYQPLNGDFTTHRFTWEPNRITWESYHGHVAGNPNPPNPITEQRPGAGNGLAAKHVYTGAVVPRDLNEIPIINFWVFGNNPSVDGPTGGAEQEMIVRSFSYTPLQPSGDFDRDGDADGQDFLIWQRGLGVGTTLDAGDADRNGVVNGADLAVWTAQAGGQAVGSVVRVPEPGSATLVVLGMLIAVRIFF